MKNIIRQILVGAWLLIGVFFIVVFAMTLDIIAVLAFTMMFGLPVWAIQLITLGVVNPLRLVKFK